MSSKVPVQKSSSNISACSDLATNLPLLDSFIVKSAVKSMLF